jgi:hypothetical protein
MRLHFPVATVPFIHLEVFEHRRPAARRIPKRNSSSHSKANYMEAHHDDWAMSALKKLALPENLRREIHNL